ncbi:integrase domain-containing protein [Vreelandella aquamarina]|uniref:integrase domain-containing protein n=1 Tax=Vreelandella aquamarina TaxID=77097 RepID=UPI003CFF3C7B
MGRYASSRNFGYGKQIKNAGKTALRDFYGQGHYGTVASHSQRWSQFAAWAKDEGVRDLAKIDSRELATAYAEHIQTLVEEKKLAVSTAKNHISTVNRTFLALRGDQHVNILPRDYVKNRSNIRTIAPAALDENRVQHTLSALREEGLNRGAAVLELARAFGVRREEAVKADLNRWSREANRHGSVNVIDGTKGGRDAPRWIPIGDMQRQALQNALAARPTGSANLIASHESYAQFAISRGGEIYKARAVLKEYNLPSYHDSRAAYACQRYEQITGSPAPVVTGERIASKQKDREARAIISAELGHGRLDVLNSYIGSSR